MMLWTFKNWFALRSRKIPGVAPEYNLNIFKPKRYYFWEMGAISIGEALKEVLERNGWKQRIDELKLRRDWEQIVGKTIARYTTDLRLHKGTLTVGTSVAPLKQELLYAKEELKQNINSFYNELLVRDIVIK